MNEYLDVKDCEVALPETFSRALKLHEEIESGTEPSAGDIVQGLVKRCIGLLESCTRMVSSLQLFSSNESIDELSSVALNYMRLPALLGEVNYLLTCDRKNRSKVVDRTIVYYQDFLTRCRDYGVYSGDIPKSYLPDGNIMQQSRNRNDKIEQHKKLKANEERIRILNEMEEDRRDEEDVRELNLLQIEVTITKVAENLSFCFQELEILKHMAERDQGPETHKPNPQFGAKKQTKNSLTRPAVLILTRDQVQKTVFGLGYPSVPTMTLDEWYEAQCANGELPERGIKSKTGDPDLDSRLEQQAKVEREEAQEERDDVTLLASRRRMDDYKDDHRKGSGNTGNTYSSYD